MFEIVEEYDRNADIKVIGVGGAGGNAVRRMIEQDLCGVEFIATNTDLQALKRTPAPIKVQIGIELTKGLGSGGRPEIGRKAIEENADRVVEILDGTDMVFITAGMGGGTGTGASPLIAKLAKESGALTIAIVTRPFDFEGRKREQQALEGLEELRKEVDTLICIPNQKLLSVVGKQTPIHEAFKIADQVLYHATKGISDLITTPGLINLDFADVRTVMSEGGEAFMGTGTGRGENRANEAASEAISSPLLDNVSISGAKGLLVNITGGMDLTLSESSDATQSIQDVSGEDANIIFGIIQNEDLDGEMRVTVIATGLGQNGEEKSIINFGSFASEDLERPTFKRKQIKKLAMGKGISYPVTRDELEIPTYLRKQTRS